jgi:hypothetical protein
VVGVVRVCMHGLAGVAITITYRPPLLHICEMIIITISMLKNESAARRAVHLRTGNDPVRALRLGAPENGAR